MSLCTIFTMYTYKLQFSLSNLFNNNLIEIILTTTGNSLYMQKVTKVSYTQSLRIVLCTGWSPSPARPLTNLSLSSSELH